MTNIERIEDMESILDESLSLIDDMKMLSARLNDHAARLEKLTGYYYSEERNRDIEDDEENLLPADLKRGVLSEDGIWNMLEDYRDAAIDLMDAGLKIIRNN